VSGCPTFSLKVEAGWGGLVSVRLPFLSVAGWKRCRMANLGRSGGVKAFLRGGCTVARVFEAARCLSYTE
jgi:hypothetical protein